MTLHASRAAAALCVSFLYALPAAAQSSCGLFEAVEPGDTFTTISERCGVAVETLIAANPGVDAAAPQVASTLSLALAEGTATTVAGEPVSPGPRILQAPAPEPQTPAAQIVVIETQSNAPQPAEPGPLFNIIGQWSQAGEVCADITDLWTITEDHLQIGDDTCAIDGVAGGPDDFLLQTVCGSNGVVVGREFTLRLLDALTLSYETGDQKGVLNRCAPG